MAACRGHGFRLRGLTVVGLELRIPGPVQAVRDGRDVPLGGPSWGRNSASQCSAYLYGFAVALGRMTTPTMEP